MYYIYKNITLFLNIHQNKIMKIVSIDNIEELILIKKEIEDKLVKDEETDELSINDFIDKYMHIEYACYFNGNIVPFGIFKDNGETYLFVSAENPKQINIVVNKLKSLRNDLNNMTEVSINEFGSNENETYIIHNNKYYK